MLNKAVSLIIPTYNGRHLLEKYLPSVLEALRSGDELVLFDDASTDDTVRWLCSEFGLVKKQEDCFVANISFKEKSVHILLIASKKNQRFAVAVNEAVRQSQHGLVLLLNNDVKPEKSILNYLLPHFQDTSVFAVGCLEYETDMTGSKSGKNKLWFEKGLYRHSKSADHTTGNTAWVSGGSGLFDKNKWQQLGGFDTVFYPAYWEDVDLSHRARKKGWKVLFEEKAVVYHCHETTNESEFGSKKIAQMSWKNAFTFTKKHAAGIQKLSYYFWKPYWNLKSKH